MFTGLIEDVGTVQSFRMSTGSAVFTVKTKLPLREMKLGASIAVNGACLTVVKKSSGQFTVDVSPETLQKTNLENHTKGTLLNLERPMRLQDRLGGHLVTGHVDGIGSVSAIKKEKEFTFLSFDVPTELGSLMVPKGSVAVDGISLTVNECNRNGFSVMIIPHTWRHTNLRARRLGDKVNIEVDLIGKYVRSFLDQQKQ